MAIFCTISLLYWKFNRKLDNSGRMSSIKQFDLKRGHYLQCWQYSKSVYQSIENELLEGYWSNKKKFDEAKSNKIIIAVVKQPASTGGLILICHLVQEKRWDKSKRIYIDST